MNCLFDFRFQAGPAEMKSIGLTVVLKFNSVYHCARCRDASSKTFCDSFLGSGAQATSTECSFGFAGNVRAEI